MHPSRSSIRRQSKSGGRPNARRWQIVGVGAVAIAMVGVGLGVASASESTAIPTVNCPSVADKLPAVPAQSAAEVQRNLALLNTQVAEANKRLSTSVGQGGVNFIQNAILGPLKDKRVSTIDRIVISIGRHGARPALDENGLGTCTLNAAGGVSAAEPASVVTAAAANKGANGGAKGGNGGAPTVNCPALTGLPAIPAQAAAEVQRNLALLNTQIAEANNRLATTVGQGGVNFIQNAILGPLAGKRTSTIDRIATAIGRNATKPNLNVAAIAPCSLNK